MTATKIVTVICSLACVVGIVFIVSRFMKYDKEETIRFQFHKVNLDNTKVAMTVYWNNNGNIDCIIKGEGKELLTTLAVLNARCILTLVRTNIVHSINEGIQALEAGTEAALEMPSVQNGFTDIIELDAKQGGKRDKF